MEKFLDFLSSNYIYFLIAAGVLFFALIGFIVDLKKKNKAEVDTGEVAQEVPIDIQQSVEQSQPVETSEMGNSFEPQPMQQEVYKPVAPVQEASPEVVPLAQTQQPVQPMPSVQPMPPVQPIPPVEQSPKIEIEEL